MPIGGANYNQIIIPRTSEIDYAVAGFPFSNPTQAGTFGIRKDGKLTLPTVARRDAIGRDQTDAKNAMLEVELWQDNFTSLYNMYLLSQGNHQIRIKLANGDWYNFVDNTATLASPNGSALVGCTFVYETTDKEMSIKGKWATKMHPNEYDWLLSNSGSGATGGASGTSNSGMTKMQYDQTQYGIPGIYDVLMGTDSVGVIAQGSKISMNFKEMEKTVRDQPITRLIEVTAEITMLQSAIADLQAVTANRNSDFTTTFKLWNGTTLVFVNSLSVVDEPNFDDAKTFNKLKFAGTIPYDPHDTQSNITWNSGTSTATFARIGYA